MALDNTKLVRAGNMDEAAELIGGSPDITVPNTYKATLTSQIDSRMESMRAGMQADYPPNYAAFYTDVFVGFKSSIDAYLAAIPDNDAVALTDACAAIKQALINYETANGLTYPCPQCGATSFITDETGKHSFCPLSGGYTQTPVAYKAVQSSITYEPA